MSLTGFEEITEDLTEIELREMDGIKSLLVKFLFPGAIIKSVNLVEIINYHYAGFDFSITPVRLRKFVNYFRTTGQLPIIATSAGYSLAQNRQEIYDQIESLRQRANAILAAAAGLKKFALELK